MTNQNNKISEELAKSLETTTSLMHDLFNNIKDNAFCLATVKTKLESLSSNIDSISDIIRGSDGKESMVTRLALVEKSVENIEENFDDLKREIEVSLKEVKDLIQEEKQSEVEDGNKEKEFKRQQVLARLKVAAVVAPGVIALAILIIKMLMGAE